jgi:hypothetical protein
MKKILILQYITLSFIVLACSSTEYIFHYESGPEGALAEITEYANPIAPDSEGNNEKLSIEECNALEEMELSIPDLGWEKNDCACSYHLEIKNNGNIGNIIIFSHMIIRVDKNNNDLWSIYSTDEIKPNGILKDGGTGWTVERFGGFYSTCRMIDGELESPEYFYTDRIGAKYATKGCEWIDAPSEYSNMTKEIPNSCESN